VLCAIAFHDGMFFLAIVPASALIFQEAPGGNILRVQVLFGFRVIQHNATLMPIPIV
jgi:hypothetical protein